MGIGTGVTAALLLIAGLVALVAGAELVVREGSALAARFGVHPIVVGMTVVALGTSLPELAIGINAAQQGNAGLAVGNIVGTNLVNVLLILGLSALLRPVGFERRSLRFDLPVMTGAAVLLLMLGADGALSTSDGLRLCGYGGFYLGALIVMTVRGPHEVEPPAGRGVPPSSVASVSASVRRDERRVAVRMVSLVAGLGVVVVGCRLSRIEGGLFVATYVAYLGWLIVARV
ncbi:sodium:calcium antiporter [Flindersiella endophytica]